MDQTIAFDEPTVRSDTVIYDKAQSPTSIGQYEHTINSVFECASMADKRNTVTLIQADIGDIPTTATTTGCTKVKWHFNDIFKV